MKQALVLVVVDGTADVVFGKKVVDVVFDGATDVVFGKKVVDAVVGTVVIGKVLVLFTKPETT
jgi:hypothetical protein